MQVLGTSTSNQRNSILKDVQILGTSETQFQKCEKKNNRSNICVVRRMDFFEGFPRCLSTFWCGSISIEVQRDRWCTWCPCNGWSDSCKDDYGCKFRLGGTKLQKTGIRSLVLADLIAIARLPSSDKIFSPCFPLHLFLGKIAKFNKRPPILGGQGPRGGHQKPWSLPFDFIQFPNHWCRRMLPSHPLGCKNTM